MRWMEECEECGEDVEVGDEDDIPPCCIYASMYFHPECYEIFNERWDAKIANQ